MSSMSLDRSIASAAPSLWKPFPYHLKSVHSLQAFKSGLKTHIFKSAYMQTLSRVLCGHMFEQLLENGVI